MLFLRPSHHRKFYVWWTFVKKISFFRKQLNFSEPFKLTIENNKSYQLNLEGFLTIRPFKKKEQFKTKEKTNKSIDQILSDLIVFSFFT